MKNILRKTYINKLLLFCLIIVAGSCTENVVEVNGNVSNTNYIASEPFSNNISVVNHIKLRLEGINGTIKILGSSDSGSVKINGTKKVSSESTRDAEDHLPDLNVTILDLGDEIFVKTTQPDESYGRLYVVDYSITVPDNFEIYVNNINGSIEVDSLENNITIIDVNGSVILDNINGSTNVALVNGQIKIEQSLPLNGTIKLTTVNGTIELDIPQSTSAHFYASVVNGNINLSNLILRNNINNTNSVSGTLGSGEGSISLQTTNGSIYVTGF